jgi:hypothetical protein
MPRLDHRVSLRHRLTPSERALVLLFRELVNDVRVQVDLPLLTEPEIEARLVPMLRNTARKDCP